MHTLYFAVGMVMDAHSYTVGGVVINAPSYVLYRRSGDKCASYTLHQEW